MTARDRELTGVHKDDCGSVRRPGLTSEWFDKVTIIKLVSAKGKHLRHKYIHHVNEEAWKLNNPARIFKVTRTWCAFQCVLCFTETKN